LYHIKSKNQLQVYKWDIKEGKFGDNFFAAFAPFAFIGGGKEP
jgi:hypothetical protein